MAISPDIAEIRSLVSTRPLLLPSVTVAVLDGDDLLVGLHRSGLGRVA